ncbi:3-oxoacyl-ACP reductase family protein [Lactobacillus ultunensis]|uniref:Putative 3-oxoacyl-[acyl-carrier-protein] reductase n=1 Tax=Lactobacillus ultunensis DSM 16047 TaxID=525365 RepID=C2EKW0_9LACO|nr:3-oxoacyl-ACP reductase family protein [Lactobacillus ultunensis]EEJ72817.1 putative 3-oxoacyl-[acyl-carrier-protein] reductase [Lactobacillus ultunensis DSM 16047]KRL83120.1 3-oxoacyl-[acyl-carrier-protein] reductase [Lactobacillus ultunensis DSM 16047]QQP29186.1 3-oxoacyl-ACP reductase FabG [Lactobacillus ultunensis]
MDLKNKVVLVTGSTHGIGAAMAVAFAQAGAKLLLNGRSESLSDELVEQLNQEKADYHYLKADLMKTDLKKFAEDAWDSYGQIDVLVNNAGINRDKLFIGMKEADFDSVINLDLKVPFFLSKWIIKKMNKQRSGVIINMSSIVGMHGNSGQANYAAAKAGLIGLTKTLAREGAMRSIRVNAIAPGMIDTEMTQKLSDRVKENILEQIPLGRLGKASEVAQTAIFLAQNDYLTGQTVVVDGGMTI